MTNFQRGLRKCPPSPVLSSYCLIHPNHLLPTPQTQQHSIPTPTPPATEHVLEEGTMLFSGLGMASPLCSRS